MNGLGPLRIRRFAQIEEVSIIFGDLTVLVGAQATGKSLTLQWLKFAIDGREVVSALRDAGHPVEDPKVLIDLLFGTGMSAAWTDQTEVWYGSRRSNVKPSQLARRGRKDGKGTVFFIPAHRAMLMSDGWAAPFQRLTADTPVVARIFSQHLFEHFSARRTSDLFPVPGKLKKPYRDAIDTAIFHGGTLGVEDDEARHARRIVLRHEDMRIPYMTWTAGQREFTPLLLGLYALLPSAQRRQTKPIQHVIIEEPEMGLHPRALNVVMMLILDLLWRGYRVILSTHSPEMLTAVWMLQQLKRNKAKWQLVLQGLGLKATQSLQDVAQAALRATYRVHNLFFDNGRVRSQDISTLDVASDDDRTATWGDLIAFTSTYGETVAKAVDEAEAR